MTPVSLKLTSDWAGSIEAQGFRSEKKFKKVVALGKSL